MPSKTIDQLIINSPYEEPREHWRYHRETRLFTREAERRKAGYVRASESFLQRLTGYCLTGSTTEHVLFFLYGTGANGKSVFLSSIAGLLGDYAKAAPVSIFTASHTEQHPTDLAGLRGFRFVTAIETEDGRWWADIESMPGVMAYGATRELAIAAVRALALRVAADCIDQGEDVPRPFAQVISIS